MSCAHAVTDLLSYWGQHRLWICTVATDFSSLVDRSYWRAWATGMHAAWILRALWEACFSHSLRLRQYSESNSALLPPHLSLCSSIFDATPKWYCLYLHTDGKKIQELTVPDYYNVLSHNKTCQIRGLLLNLRTFTWTKQESWMLIKHTIPFKEHVNTLIANSLVGTANRKRL